MPVHRSVLELRELTHELNDLGFLVPGNALTHKIDQSLWIKGVSLSQLADSLDPFFPLGVRDSKHDGF